MNRKLSLIVIAGVTLVACKQETIVGKDTPDPMAEELAKAAPVELPPAIAASKTYRCKDNGLVTVDWLQGGKGANLRIANATTPVQLKLAEAVEGQPASTDLTADGGYALKGAASANSVTLTLPGKSAQACHV